MAYEDGYLTERRSPRGERGLKLFCSMLSSFIFSSLPPRGAWIEIMKPWKAERICESLPPRGAWIEILSLNPEPLDLLSLPPRGAWIEIYPVGSIYMSVNVAPPAGSVD